MIRLRHYTRVSSMRKILEQQRIVARDQNKVFVERANRKPMAPKDVEDLYQLKHGRGDAYIEFDAREEELGYRYNVRIRDDEWYLLGDVDLAGRAAVGRYNF